jgi:hypothetical protein
MIYAYANFQYNLRIFMLIKLNYTLTIIYTQH